MEQFLEHIGTWIILYRMAVCSYCVLPLICNHAFKTPATLSKGIFLINMYEIAGKNYGFINLPDDAVNIVFILLIFTISVDIISLV